MIVNMHVSTVMNISISCTLVLLVLEYKFTQFQCQVQGHCFPIVLQLRPWHSSILPNILNTLFAEVLLDKHNWQHISNSKIKK